MIRELTDGRVRLGLERHPRGAVQAHATIRPELVDEDRTHQSVREGVSARVARRLADQAGLLGWLQCLEDRAHRFARNLGDEPDVELAPDHRSHAEHGVRGLGELSESTPDHLPYPLGQAGLVEGRARPPSATFLHQPARLDEVAQHLADEERVALGLAPQGCGEVAPLGVEVVATGPDEQRGDALAVEPGERDPARPPLAAKIGQHPGERMRAVDVGVAVRREHQDRSRCVGSE